MEYQASQTLKNNVFNGSSLGAILISHCISANQNIPIKVINIYWFWHWMYQQTSLIFIHACGRVKLVKIACTINSYYFIKWHYSSKELSDHSVLKVLVHSTVTICYTKLHIWINLSLNSISYQQNHLPNPKSPADNVHASVWKREVCYN